MAIPNDITEQALGLDLEERARLAKKLLESLDGLIEAEIENLWLDEAERRIREYEAGRMAAIPSDEGFREVHELLR